MKKIADTILETIGHTPLVRINRLTRGVIKGTVLAKIETFNPGNSIKDRMAVRMIEDAERAGLLQARRDHHRGHVGQHRHGPRDRRRGEGLQVRLHHHRQAVEGEGGRIEGVRRRRDRLPDERGPRGSALVLLGLVTPGARDPEQLEGESVPQSLELGGPLRADGTRNLGPDRRAHHAPRRRRGDRWDDQRRRPLPEGAEPEIKVWGIDTYGSVFKKYKETGIFDKNEIYPYITEGIGEDFLPQNVDFSVIDHFEKVTDRDAAIMTRRIAREEGIFAGNSAGSAMAGLLQLRDHFAADDVVVVIFHDHGTRYLGKMYNDDWMREKGFLETSGMTAARSGGAACRANCARSKANEPVAHAIKLMSQHDFSQISVTQQRAARRIAERDAPVRGAGARSRRCASSRSRRIMQPAFPFVDVSTSVDLLATMITPQNPAVLRAGFQDGQDVHHHAVGHDSGHGVDVRSTTPLLVMATVGLGAVVSSSSDVTPLAARIEARIKGERATVACTRRICARRRTSVFVPIGGSHGEHHQAAHPLRARIARCRWHCKWDERVRLRAADKISGSGILADLEEGTELSIRNLATLMIIVSDNTATNLVLDRITADAVNDYLDTIGLTETRALRKVRGDVEPRSGHQRNEPRRTPRDEPAVRPRQVHAS